MPKKILIIDDEPEICKMLAQSLFDAGYSTSYALSGPEGLAMIRKDLPSLVLLDIGMPGMGGLEVMRFIHEQYPELRVVVLSGQQDPDMVKKMGELGVSEYLTKPISPDTLLNQFVKDLIGTP
jgi:CheY-like chemotaxis protein